MWPPLDSPAVPQGSRQGCCGRQVLPQLNALHGYPTMRHRGAVVSAGPSARSRAVLIAEDDQPQLEQRVAALLRAGTRARRRVIKAVSGRADCPVNGSTRCSSSSLGPAVARATAE
jgi:hypothetical protein